MGYRLLPVSDLPTVDFPTIQVNANLPGASPETMASAVATPLEKQFSTIAGVDLDQLEQLAGQHEHHAAVRPEPQHRRGRAGRAVDDRASVAIDAARHAGAARRSEGEPGGRAGAVPHAQLADVAAVAASIATRESVLAQRLSMVAGVAQVNVFGAQKYAVRVDVDPTQLAAAADRHRPGGARRSRARSRTGPPAPLRARSQLRRPGERSADDAPRRTAVVVAYRNGSPVRLTRSRTSTTASRTTRRRAGTTARAPIYLAIQRQPGTNTVEVVDRSQGAAAAAPGAAAGRGRAGDPQRPIASRFASPSTTSSSRCS